MKDELQTALLEKYPKIFAVSDGRKLLPFPMFGIECSDGWYDIINQLCFQIQNYIDWNNQQRQRLLEKNPNNIKVQEEIPQVIVSQVKEKFGTLRFYYDGGDNRIDGMVRMAEAMSSVICETCGNRGHIRGRHWLYTACDEHSKPEDLVDK